MTNTPHVSVVELEMGLMCVVWIDYQFDKVEILRIEHPDHSDGALDAMVVHVKES
jgi:hypothetical protein